MLDILYVGGERKDTSVIKDLPVTLDHVQNGMIALSALRTEQYDGIVIHDNLPMLTPNRLVKEIRGLNRHIPIFNLIESEPRRSEIFDDLGNGATFYFEPQTQNLDLMLEMILMGKQYYDFIAELSPVDRQFFHHAGNGNIIGISEQMINLFRLITQIRKKDVTTILYGDSGTGKNLIAHSLHNNSLKKNNPFISVNCPAIPKELLESELFGHTKGSFTGADSDKEGKFQAANSGTIFLDEIGDMDLGLQAKILRVLESGEVEKVGSNKTINVNVRIISATNQNLPEMVEKKDFRQDLYHRINVFPITIPSLKDHPGDIPLISYSILKNLCEKHSSSVNYITADSLALLKEYNWPGNVRELENVLERALLTSIDNEITLADVGPLIELSGKPELETPTLEIKDNQDSQETVQENPDASHHQYYSKDIAEPIKKEETVLKSLKELEIEAIQKTLKHTDNNMSKASKILGISRMTLYRKIDSYGLNSDE